VELFVRMEKSGSARMGATPAVAMGDSLSAHLSTVERTMLFTLPIMRCVEIMKSSHHVGSHPVTRLASTRMVHLGVFPPRGALRMEDVSVKEDMFAHRQENVFFQNNVQMMMNLWAPVNFLTIVGERDVPVIV